MTTPATPRVPTGPGHVVIDQETFDLFAAIAAAATSGATWDRNAILGALYPHTLTDKVGIGTATPAASLDIYGTLAALGTIHGLQTETIGDEVASIMACPAGVDQNATLPAASARRIRIIARVDQRWAQRCTIAAAVGQSLQLYPDGGTPGPNFDLRPGDAVLMIETAGVGAVAFRFSNKPNAVRATNVQAETFAVTDKTIVHTTGANVCTAQLPASSLPQRGRRVRLVKGDAGAGTTTPVPGGLGPDAIGYAGGAAPVLTTQDDYLDLEDDGAGTWIKLAGRVGGLAI